MDYGAYLASGVSRNTVATLFVADSMDKLGDSLQRDGRHEISNVRHASASVRGSSAQTPYQAWRGTLLATKFKDR